MREIKFRAWDGEQIMPAFWVDERKDFFGLIYQRGMSKVQFMQYTGLKDKNGKEIYEGDIVKYDSGNLFGIEFKFGKWLCVNKNDDLKTGILYDLLNASVEIEVISNIYENPELLKK